jgi:hypothetical protein
LKTLIVLCALAWIWLAALPARGQEVYFYASLTGAAVSPPNNSAGVGAALVYIDLGTNFLHFDVSFSGLASAVVGAHLHGLTTMPGMGTAAAATPEPNLNGFSTGSASGLYHGIFDLTSESTYDAAFLATVGGTATLASDALLMGLTGGLIYFDIHTAGHPGGELSGFLAPAPTADFDHNGRVDGADLNLWTIGVGPSAFADADHDGSTTGNDFLFWQRQLGSVATVPGHGHHHAEGSVNTVAEPASLSAAMLAFVILAAARREARG